jgi:hypothetical protein
MSGSVDSLDASYTSGMAQDSRGLETATQLGSSVQIQHRVAQLASLLEGVRQEVDALQVAAMRTTAPWYKQAAVVVSAMALLFSFGTTYVSYRHTESQDVQASRTELRSILQRLSALPRENAELQDKYKLDPAVLAGLSGMMNQENSILSSQAVEVAERISDKVTATESYAIAMALQNSYQAARSAEFLRHAIDKATDMNADVSAVRAYGGYLFAVGQAEAGRQQFAKAVDIGAKYPDQIPAVVTLTRVWSELQWSTAEAQAGFRQEARQHVDRAADLAATMPPGPMTEQVRAQVRQAVDALAKS